MDTGRVTGILSGVIMSHPTLMSVGSQLYAIYNAHKDELTAIAGEYQHGAEHSTSTLETVGVALDLMKKYPDISPLLIQVLGLLAPNIPELQKAIAQLQQQVTTYGDVPQWNPPPPG